MMLNPKNNDGLVTAAIGCLVLLGLSIVLFVVVATVRFAWRLAG